MNCHLTPFDHKLKQRLADYRHIVERLLFSPISPDSKDSSTLYETSHLFLLGDLNFRLDLPKDHRLYHMRFSQDFSQAIDSEQVREELKEFDQLTVERRKGTAFVGLHEGEFWKFKCSYKYKIGEVDKYRYSCSSPESSTRQRNNVKPHSSVKRTPSWTDRVLYATYTDSPEKSTITNLIYTSIPSYTTSDHVRLRFT